MSATCPKGRVSTKNTPASPKDHITLPLAPPSSTSFQQLSLSPGRPSYPTRPAPPTPSPGCCYSDALPWPALSRFHCFSTLLLGDLTTSS